MTEPIAEPAALARAHRDQQPGHLLVLGSLLLSVMVLAYFYVADHYVLTTQYMSTIFQYLLMLDDASTAWLTLAACLLAVLWKRSAPILRLVDFLSAHIIAVAVAITALLALGALFIYHNNAFSMDEYAAVFQAKAFAAGRLTGLVPPSVVNWLVPRGFNGSFLIASHSTGEIMSGYWPGFSLLLSPFEYLRIPWLCNPVLAGVSLILIHRITLEITADRRAAGWAVLFAIASGVFAAYAISYYSMQSHLTANLLFAWLLLKPTRARALMAGVVGSLALVLHNPFPHTLFAIPWIVGMARLPEQQRFVLPLLAGYLPLALVLGVEWLHLRGVLSAGTSGLNLVSDSVGNYFSFPDRAMLNAQLASMAKLWIWALPGLFPLALLGRLRFGTDWRVRRLTQSAVLTLIGYVFFVFDQGHGWGYRYFHSAFGVVPILAGCGIAACTQRSHRLVAFAGAAAVLNLVMVLPVQMQHIQHIIARHMALLPPARRPGNNVYFVQAAVVGFYLRDLVQMDPLLRDPDLILYSPGHDSEAELLRENWPGATLVGHTFGVDQWYLGPRDQRRETPELPGVKRFVFSDSSDPALPGAELQ